ncbi:Armadillo-type fold [Arabidopsis suecica]|uniref:Armadillo-type fold n=1 Tax=Arabidopsis suecica TaxID=45249 RepID=A0A8T2G1W9_ARASU|nr:Armadillo-type fold [Arabidopsis suecica]
MNHNRTCPKSKQVLYRVCLTPNHLINELITRWCLVSNSKYDRPAPKPSDIEIVTELFTDGIELLLQRISSPSSSVADQTEAAKELALQSSKFVQVRDFFIKELSDSITRLLTPLSVLGDEVDSNPELQENIVTTLFNMSTFEENKTLLAENHQVIPVLAKFMKQKSVVTRRNATLTLVSLLDIDSNKIIIGNSVALKALIDLIGELDDLSATHEALCAVIYLCCDEMENWKKAISLGLTPFAVRNIKARRNSFDSLVILALISLHERVIQELANLGVIYDLLSILILEEQKLHEEENQHKTFTKLAMQGSPVAVMKAQGIYIVLGYFLLGMCHRGLDSIIKNQRYLRLKWRIRHGRVNKRQYYAAGVTQGTARDLVRQRRQRSR